jgi:hypothetical protein
MKIANLRNLCTRGSLLLGAAAVLAACATQQPESGEPANLASSPWTTASSSAVEAVPWRHQQFPGKRHREYRYMRVDGRDTMMVQASSSASMLRQVVRVEAADLHQLRFSWKVPALIASADLTVRELADSPVRVVLAFEGDRSKFAVKDAMLSELAHALTGEPMPYATLIYVWCNNREPGSVLVDPSTSRIRKIVMESGTGNLHRWMDYERDIRTDYLKAFGEQPGTLVTIGIMTDTDNTLSTAHAWYGPVRHVPATAAP